MNRNYEDLQSFYRQTPPRDINKRDYSNSSPLARLFIILGGILSAMMLSLAIMTVLISTRAQDGQISPMPLLILGIIFLVTASMAVYGILAYKKSKNLLRSGILSEATVQTVKALPARLNDKTFFKVKVNVTDGTSPSTINDIVDNYALDYFLDARDSQTPVDVLTLPASTKGILIYKLHTAKRLD